MQVSRIVAAGSVFLLGACAAPATSPEADAAAPLAATADARTGGLVRKLVPQEDAGPPLYLRATRMMNELFHTDEWLAIPFYRDPACVPADFNLLDHFDFPGPNGPGALGCPLVVHGSLLIEPDAPLGTFPQQAILEGDAVPVWFVSWPAFEAAAADGVVTFAELQALAPLKGTASRFHEVLFPRPGGHRITIEAAGALEDGRAFRFGVVSHEGVTKSIRVELE